MYSKLWYWVERLKHIIVVKINAELIASIKLIKHKIRPSNLLLSINDYNGLSIGEFNEQLPISKKIIINTIVQRKRNISTKPKLNAEKFNW